MLAYGVPADALDECIRIGESTTLEALRNFVVAVVEVFGPEYLRMSNQQDTATFPSANFILYKFYVS